MTIIKAEKNTQTILGVSVLVMAAVWILASFGKLDWMQYVAMSVGILLGAVLLSEGAVLAYFKQQKYRSLDGKDFVVWLTIVFAAAIWVNSVLVLQIVRNSAPDWLLSFATTTGVITGAGAALLAIVHMVTSRHA